MKSELKRYVVAGLDARIRELQVEAERISAEMFKLEALKGNFSVNGHAPETMEKKLASTEKIRAAWRASKAKARAASVGRHEPDVEASKAKGRQQAKAGKPTGTSRRIKAAQSDADQVLSLLTAYPTPSTVLRNAVKPRDWRLTMKILKTMPGVIVEGNTTRMTLRAGEKS